MPLPRFAKLLLLGSAGEKECLLLCRLLHLVPAAYPAPWFAIARPSHSALALPALKTIEPGIWRTREPRSQCMLNAYTLPYSLQFCHALPEAQPAAMWMAEPNWRYKNRSELTHRPYSFSA